MANPTFERWSDTPINAGSKSEDATGIFHVSDLHFTAETNWQAPPFSTVLSDFAQLAGSIDLIVCTGDVLDSSVTDYLGGSLELAAEKARAFLLKVCEACEVEPQTALFVIPGNHDCRLKGISAWLGSNKLFNRYFGEFFRSVVLPKMGLSICSFDSNGVDRRVNMATGVVENQEFADLRDWLVRTRIDDSYQHVSRLALLHHHPMPISETETRRTTAAVEFLILKNAATFMREMLKARIDLILHGHEHFIGYSRASFRVEAEMREVGVIAAGSIGKLYNGIHSYNVLRIPRRGQIKVEQRVLNNGTYDKGHKFLIPDSYSEWRRQNAARLGRIHGVEACGKSFASEIDVDKEGDAHRCDFIRGLEPLAPKRTLKKMSFVVSSAVGRFDEPHPECVNDQLQHVEIKPPTGPAAEMYFDPELTIGHPLDINIRRNVYNAFCFYQDDRKAATNGKEETESAGARVMRLYESLCLSVRINTTVEIREPRVRVFQDGQRQDKYEEQYCRNRLTYDRELQTLHLSVDHPLPGHDYQIVWNLPQQHQELRNDLRINAESVEEELDKLPISPVRGSGLNTALTQLRDHIANQFDLTDRTQDLEIALMCRDLAARGLLRVAIATFSSGHPIYRWKLVSGQGLEGQAFKRRTLVCGVSGNEFWKRYYVPVPGTVDATTMIYALPLSYPINSPRVVAVLRLSSTSRGTKLLRTADDQNLQGLIAKPMSEYYVKNVLSFAGLRPPYTVVSEDGTLLEATVQELTGLET